MKIPDMGRDSSRELIEKIKERASSYTPEWRMDLEHPDGGRAVRADAGPGHDDGGYEPWIRPLQYPCAIRTRILM